MTSTKQQEDYQIPIKMAISLCLLTDISSGPPLGRNSILIKLVSYQIQRSMIAPYYLKQDKDSCTETYKEDPWKKLNKFKTSFLQMVGKLKWISHRRISVSIHTCKMSTITKKIMIFTYIKLVNRNNWQVNSKGLIFMIMAHMSMSLDWNQSPNVQKQRRIWTSLRPMEVMIYRLLLSQLWPLASKGFVKPISSLRTTKMLTEHSWTTKGNCQGWVSWTTISKSWG